jgi:Xaa-Pro aminopeptidase
VSAAFPGQLVVVPAGTATVRANDTDYPFRASSSFTWLTGETAADAVLVLTPDRDGHTSTLYLAEYAQAGQPGYFLNRAHGALWVGNVPSVEDTAAALGLQVRSQSELRGDLAAYRDSDSAVLTGFDPDVDRLLPRGRGQRLAQLLDELRLIKDEWELDRLREACAATARGFADVVAQLPAVVGRPDVRGERWLEGTFWRRARLEGNDVGYGSIVGAGAHATILHWVRNSGVTKPGELLLMDMGVEGRTFYTADVTRTLPVSGTFTPLQRQVYDIVYASQQAGMDAVRPGVKFKDVHLTCMRVLAEGLHDLGLLPVSVDEAMSEESTVYRRWTLHGFGHMLGIDVHDCSFARKEAYREGPLGEGYVLTVEPGLYFQPEDDLVPAELRGIGIRIEDDVLVTADGCRNLSAGLPRTSDQVETWLAAQREAGPRLPE